MAKTTSVSKIKSSKLDRPSVGGRKRDPSLEGNILDAAIGALAEVGFDQLTMDQVAARAGSAKTSIYRRWASKAELVRDALIWMSRGSVDLDTIPDTGSLRNDLLNVQRNSSSEHGERKVQVLSKLGSFYSGENQKFAEEVMTGVFGPMSALNAKLMTRAIAVGEIRKDADIETACQTITAVIAYQTSVLRKSFTRADYAKLLDSIILPALK